MIRSLLWVAFASVCLFLAVLGVSATEIVFGFGVLVAEPPPVARGPFYGTVIRKSVVAEAVRSVLRVGYAARTRACGDGCTLGVTGLA